MKKVFSNSELAHVWAQQNQSEGRNPRETMYFRNTEIYSYGSHYLMAKFHGDKVLVNEYSYSSSTCQQRGHVTSAISHLDYFYVPYPGNIESNIDYFKNNIASEIEQLIKGNNKNAEMYFVWINREYQKYLDYCKAFNLKIDVEIDWKNLTEIKDYKMHLHNEKMNDPKRAEKLEKQRQQALKQKQKKELKENIRKLIKIKNWIKGENNYLSYSDRTKTSFLRIKENEVQTSGGARVPLNHAIRLYRLIKTRAAKNGERVGHYTFNRVENNAVIIGCHRILMKEADRVLSKYNFEVIK